MNGPSRACACSQRDGLDMRGGERRRRRARPTTPVPRRAAAVPFLAERQVAAGVQPQIVAHPRPVMADKPDHPAVMVAVRMAEDEPVELLGRDAEQVEIAQSGPRG